MINWTIAISFITGFWLSECINWIKLRKLKRVLLEERKLFNDKRYTEEENYYGVGAFDVESTHALQNELNKRQMALLESLKDDKEIP